MEKYVVECYPKDWDEPFRREYFDERKDAQRHAVYMNMRYPRVIVLCEVYEQGKLGCQDSYIVSTLRASKDLDNSEYDYGHDVKYTSDDE